MAGFIKLRYNANGLLKNRIINADSIEAIEPFSAPGGRYVEETRARIFMKNGTKYDMSLSVDEIQKLLHEAGAIVAEIQSKPPEKSPVTERQIQKISTLPSAPANLYKRSIISKQVPGDATRKPAEVSSIKGKATDSARKMAEAIRG